MRVRVLVFGVLRDQVPEAEQWLDLPQSPQTVGDLLRQVAASWSEGARSLLPRLAIAVNQQYVQGNHALSDGDEVALLPPVSGGLAEEDDASSAAGFAAPVLLTEQPLQSAAVEALKAGSDGAVVVFDGIVRDNTRGRRTQYLVYDAYREMALQQMHALAAEARTRFAVRDVLLHHRLGRLEIGESSVLIAVASAHRGAAFDACRWLIDTLKKTVPIWKKEFFVDGAIWADGEPFPADLLP